MTIDTEGLTLNVYRSTYRSSNCVWNRPGGPDRVTVVAIRDERDPRPTLKPLPRECRVFAPHAASPAAVLVIRSGRHYHIEPLTQPAETRTPYMAGGCFADTSDSRWRTLIDGMYAAVPVHDYCETWQQYAAMTVD